MTRSEPVPVQVMPTRRLRDLIIREVDDAGVVYDLRTDTVTLLDAETLDVWRRCDGVSAQPAVAADLGIDEDGLTVALARVAQADLLEADGVGRRQLITRAATIGAAAALTAIPAPAAAAAASLSAVVPPTATLTRLSCSRGSSNALGSTLSVRIALRNWASNTQYRVTLRFPSPGAPTNDTAGSTTIAATTNGASQFTSTSAVTFKVPRSNVRTPVPVQMTVATVVNPTVALFTSTSSFASC